MIDRLLNDILIVASCALGLCATKYTRGIGYNDVLKIIHYSLIVIEASDNRLVRR